MKIYSEILDAAEGIKEDKTSWISFSSGGYGDGT